MTMTAHTPAPRPRRPRGWAARFGDFATQYDTSGGAAVTLIRFTHPAVGYWECQCGARNNTVRLFSDQPYPQARADAETHAATCTAPRPCPHCRGAGTLPPRR